MRIFPAVWHKDCQRYHGRLLTGTHAHYCGSWDDLPVDETTAEWPACQCFTSIPVPDPPDVAADGAWPECV